MRYASPRRAALAAATAMFACGAFALPAPASPARATCQPADPRPPAIGTTARRVHLALPRPTGSFCVGVRTASVSDPSRIDPATHRPRRLPIWVWYPARGHGDGPRAPYLSPVVQQLFEQFLGVPDGLFDIDTHATLGAPARPHVRGVILFQPGGGSLAALYTGLVVDLASHGYAVVATDHPHDALVVEEPDGTLVYEDPGSETKLLGPRLRDADVVLDALHRLVPEAGRNTPVGMFGHSRGAAATPELMLHDRRVRAGVGLDIATILFSGDPPGDVVEAGLDAPFGVMCSLDQPCDQPPIAGFVPRLRGPHPVRQLAVAHNGYSDFVVFNPQAQRDDPALGAALEATIPSGVLDHLRAGYHAMFVERRFLASFMRRHLIAG